jgi:hypothetical protein
MKYLHIGNYTIILEITGITILNIKKEILFGYMNIRYCLYKWKTRKVVYRTE